MTLSKIHWQLDRENHSEINYMIYNIASYRMRLGLTLNKNFKHKISVGYKFNNQAKIVLLPKITINYEDILVFLDKYKKANAKVILDYTDNHYLIKSKHHNFYKKVFDNNLIDQVIVNSNKMKKLVETFFKGYIEIIPDPLEIKNQKITYVNQNNFLWFGHMSNFEYLIKKLNEWPKAKINTLKVITNYTPDMLPYFRNMMTPYLKEIFNFFELYPWSHDHLINQSKNIDKIIIPGNKEDLKKTGVSSNRLITSFALGKMIAATNYDSYMPYSDYYVDIDDEKKFNDFIKDSFKEGFVKKAMHNVLPNYSKELISRKWEDFISNLL